MCYNRKDVVIAIAIFLTFIIIFQFIDDFSFISISKDEIRFERRQFVKSTKKLNRSEVFDAWHDCFLRRIQASRGNPAFVIPLTLKISTFIL